jgi:DNA-binding MarR family transcriptional regulator
MANLGKFGAMTARDICVMGHIDKTKVSRAVAQLEREGMLARSPSATDRRAEMLCLTDKGLATFFELGERAVAFDKALRNSLGPRAADELNRILQEIIAMRGLADEPGGDDAGRAGPSALTDTTS